MSGGDGRGAKWEFKARSSSGRDGSPPGGEPRFVAVRQKVPKPDVHPRRATLTSRSSVQKHGCAGSIIENRQGMELSTHVYSHGAKTIACRTTKARIASLLARHYRLPSCFVATARSARYLVYFGFL